LSSAVAYTNGLNDEPGWRIAWVARSNWLWSNEKPPTSASTRPVSGSIATMPPAISGIWRSRYWPESLGPTGST
jgi:hypothetical protein